MLAVKPKILRNMNEDTLTEVERGEAKRKSKSRKENDDKMEKAFVTDNPIADENNIMACEIHPDRTVEYYCRVHGALPCSRCAMELHRKCQVMEIIEDIAKLPNATKELNTVSQKLDAATSQIETLRVGDRRVLTNLDGSVEKIQSELKQHKGKINRIIDSIEMRLVKQTDKIYNERTKQITGHLDICNDINAKLLKLRLAMERVLESNNDTEKFVTLQKVKKSLQSLNSPMNNVQKDAIDVQLYLKLGVDIEKTLEHIDKRMLIEMKTLRRKEQPAKFSMADNTKRNPADTKLNLNTSLHIPRKPKTHRENPHKFLAQRNFRPYKVRPYTVEKKTLSRGQLNPFGSMLSVRTPRLKPLIVLSTDNVHTPNSGKRKQAGSIVGESIRDDASDLQSIADTVDERSVDLTRYNYNKTISKRSTDSRYLWGKSANRQGGQDRKVPSDARSVRTVSAMTTASKATIYNSTNNHSVLKQSQDNVYLKPPRNQKQNINPYTGLPVEPKTKTAQKRFGPKETPDKTNQNRQKGEIITERIHTEIQEEDSDMTGNVKVEMKTTTSITQNHDNNEQNMGMDIKQEESTKNIDKKVKNGNASKKYDYNMHARNSLSEGKLKENKNTNSKSNGNLTQQNASKGYTNGNKVKNSKRVSDNGRPAGQTTEVNSLYPVPEKSKDDLANASETSKDAQEPTNANDTTNNTANTAKENDTTNNIVNTAKENETVESTQRAEKKTVKNVNVEKRPRTKSADRIKRRQSSSQLPRAKSDFSATSQTNI